MPRVPKNFAPMRTVGARIKKAKVVFDPSENNLRKKRTLSTTCVTEELQPVQKPRKCRPTTSINEKQRVSSESPPVLEPQVSNGNSDTCVVCEKIETKKNRKLIRCKDCNYKVHPGCLNISFENPKLVEERWRCKNCKTCIVCDETREAGYLLTCCVCLDAYHYNCHTPQLQRIKVNKSKWECEKCSNIMKCTLPNQKAIIESKVESNHDKNNEITIFPIASISLTSGSNSDAPRSRVLKRCKSMKPKSTKPTEARNVVETISDNEKLSSSTHQSQVDRSSIAIVRYHKLPLKICQFFDSNEEIPDISDWSCNEMANYIERYSPEAARIFREQEIDGVSCLLLKRNDVINGLSLNLGPALRLYCIIAALQTRKRDISLTWM